MRWHRATDYHGSRSYTEAPPISMFSLTLAWLANIARAKWRNLGGAQSGSLHVLLHEGQHSFSLLGATRRSEARERPVPVKAQAWDGQDWRVLP
jgi:hypothetical protein